MSHTCRTFDASPATVFAILSDAPRYADWLVGAANIRDHDAHWPAPGAQFHHTVGIRPFALMDTTTVDEVEPGRMLRLLVRAKPLISARVTFLLVGDEHGCTVCMEEEPSLRLVGNVVRPLLDPVVHLRNHRSLRRLEQIVVTPTPARGSPS
jgi:uncharacterized protein YndB with AHSA1/START domain